MGYTEATITGANFRLRKERQDAALASVRSWLAGDLGYDLEVPSLDAAFKLFGIATRRDERGDIVDLEFDGVLLLETDDLFEGVAPHVESGSFIDWQGGRGDTWRYRFTDGTLQREPDNR